MNDELTKMIIKATKAQYFGIGAFVGTLITGLIVLLILV